MKVDVKKSGPCQVKLVVKAEADETRDDYKAVLGVFLKKGRVPGFRMGKVPREIILREFHNEIQQEVVAVLFRKLSVQAFEESKIEMVALRDVQDMIFSPETGIVFTVYADVEPEFDLPKYKKLQVPKESVVVDDARIDAYLQEMRRVMGNFEQAEADYTALNGDLVGIDFTGTIEGSPIVELAPEAESISSGTDFWVRLEDGAFVKEVIEALQGMKAGESAGVAVEFPQDHGVEALRGKKAHYEVTVKSIRKLISASDEVLVKQFGVATFEEVRERCGEHLQRQAESQERERRETQVREFLLKKADFDLPESLVNREISVVLESLLHDVRNAGLTREMLEKNKDQILGGATQTARSNLRLRYICRAIAAQEGIEVTEAEFGRAVAALAGRSGKSAAEFADMLEKGGRSQLLRDQLLESKLMEHLLKEVDK